MNRNSTMNLKRLGRALALGAGCLGMMTAQGALTPDATDLRIGGDRQFFFDDVVIEWSQHLTRRMYPLDPAEAPPVITKDRPWEVVPYFICSSWRVLRDPTDNLFKAWYEDWMVRDQSALALDGKHIHSGTVRPSQQLYAHSTDGFHWEKPAVGVHFEGGHDTNIVIPASQAGSAHDAYVFLDPLETRADRRYKMIFQRWYPDESRGFEIASSPDGIHWSIWEDKPDFGADGNQLGDVTTLAIDIKARRYLLNGRHPGMGSVSPLTQHPKWSSFIRPYYPGDWSRQNKRRVFQAASSDLLNWSKLRPILVPNDDVDNIDDSFYGMLQYQSGGMWIGFLHVFHMTDNTIEVQLVYSRNGTDFARFMPGRPFLAMGPPGSWYRYMVNVPNPPVEVGDDLYVYFGGSRNRHDWWLFGQREGLSSAEGYDMKLVDYSLGLAKMKKDRYVSLSSNEQREGILVTKPVTFIGERLLINARCRPGGVIQAEIADAWGNPIPGYERDSSIGFSGDDVSHEMQWKGRKGLPGGNRFTKFHFYIKDADLFTFEVEP